MSTAARSTTAAPLSCTPLPGGRMGACPPDVARRRPTSPDVARRRSTSPARVCSSTPSVARSTHPSYEHGTVRMGLPDRATARSSCRRGPKTPFVGPTAFSPTLAASFGRRPDVPITPVVALRAGATTRTPASHAHSGIRPTSPPASPPLCPQAAPCPAGRLTRAGCFGRAAARVRTTSAFAWPTVRPRRCARAARTRPARRRRDADTNSSLRTPEAGQVRLQSSPHCATHPRAGAIGKDSAVTDTLKAPHCFRGFCAALLASRRRCPFTRLSVVDEKTTRRHS